MYEVHVQLGRVFTNTNCVARQIPTWVAQWDIQNTLHNLLCDDTCVYDPSKGRVPMLKLENASKTLVIDGLEIDTVSTVSDILKTPDFSLGSDTVMKLWLEQCGYDEISTEPKYINSEPAVFAFLETLSAVKRKKQEAPSPLTQRLRDGASFLVQAFNTKYKISKGVMELGSTNGKFSKWAEKASGGANNRRFIRSVKGWNALCPPAIREGDILCLLFGGRTLYCLRKVEDYYLFIGECYVHALMDGEGMGMLESAEIEQTTFRIQ